MIEYRCDGCGVSTEIDHLPKGWAAIHTKIDIGLKGGSMNTWESDNPVLLCATCSLSDYRRVEQLALLALRKGLAQPVRQCQCEDCKWARTPSAPEPEAK